MSPISTTAPARDVSVVVPVHDAADDLYRCLSAVRQADFGAREVIVVDDGSTDGSGDVARALGVRVERLPKCGGAAAARNHGARCARGDVLLFLDADVVAGEDALRRMTTLLGELPAYAAAFGSYDDAPDVRTIVARFRNLLHHHTHQMGEREADTFWTGFGVVRREVFEEVGGFDPAWTGLEDIELGYRLRARGHRIRLEPGLQVKHLKRWTLRSMVTTDFRYRARLWTRLILSRGALPDDLNVRREQRLSVLLALVATAAVVASLFDLRWLLFAGAAIALLCWLNRGFYALLRRKGGVAFAAACVPLHVVYFLSAGLGFALVWAELRLPRPWARKGERASV